MYLETLSDKQAELLPYINPFKNSFYLVGGTAIALQIGHRRSIDFDLFTYTKLNKSRIRQNLLQIPLKQQIIFEDVDQMHFYVNEVKLTFFNYPYPVEHLVRTDQKLSMPTLLSLAAMKAFALGRRAKWKDYLDLYFLIKYHFSISQIATEAKKIFDTQFSEKLFREQLSFHKDIDYTEKVEFMPGFEVEATTIKNFLIDKALEW